VRILVATHNYPRRSGDHAGSFVARLAVGLRERGHELLVVAPHAPGALENETLDGVAVARFRYAPVRWETVAYRGDMHRRPLASIFGAVALPAFLSAFAIALRGAERRFAPDLVHAHWWLPAGLLASRLRVPLVVTSHGSDVRLLERSPMVRRLAAGVFERAGAVTTVSEFLARDLAAALPGAARDVRTLRMPVALERFAPMASARRAAPPLILYAGNLFESKGVGDLLSAFALLRRRGVQCRLRLVGGGPDEGKFRRLARELGLDDDVSWAGVVAHDRMPAEYGAATVTALVSRGQAEGLGLTLVEALASGSAVVGSPAGGIPEVVLDGQTGLIARDGDPDHLAEQLERLLRDTALRERLVAAGRDHVHRLFDAGPAVTAFDALYREVVDRRRGRGAGTGSAARRSG